MPTGRGQIFVGLTTLLIRNHRKFRFKILKCRRTCKQQEVNEGLFEIFFARCFSSKFYNSESRSSSFPPLVESVAMTRY
jgi:hypothetical protein